MHAILVLAIVATKALAQMEYCSEGTYGDNCELMCSNTCRPLQFIPCDKATGKCSEGCVKGYYGAICDKLCTCPSGFCIQETGGCIDGIVIPETTTTKSYSSTSMAPVSVTVCEGVSVAWVVIAVMLLVLLIVVAVLICLYIRQRNKSKKTTVRDLLGDVFTCLSTSQGTTVSKNEADRPMIDTDVEAQTEPNGPLLSDDIATEEHVRVHEQENKREETDSQVAQLEAQKRSAESAAEDYKQKLKDYETRMKQRDDELSRCKSEQEKILENLGFPYDSTFALTSNTLDKSMFIEFPHLKFDKEAVNITVTHIDDNSMLLNKPDPRNYEDVGNRFKHYSGTSSINPLTYNGFKKYFEVDFHFELDEPLGDMETLMEIGFCGEHDKDIQQFTQDKKHCWSLRVIGCPTSKKLCYLANKSGKKEKLMGFVDNARGSKGNIKIGILFSCEMKKLRFFDWTNPKMAKTFELDRPKTLWPMFGLGAQHVGLVSMTIVAGANIEMSQEKKKIIDASKLH